MLSRVKPYARSAKWLWLYHRACRVAAGAKPGAPGTPLPVAFILGCGRSGTTILGKVVSLHPAVYYLYEPRHLWAAVDRRLDMINLYHRGDDVKCIVGPEMATDTARARFDALLLEPARRSNAKLLLEKTPINSMRIGFLEKLVPEPRYVKIVRDCVDVSRSVDKLATLTHYRMAHRPHHNQWWGDDFAKWKTLARDGRAAGCFGDEVGRLETHAERGAYEWLLSMIEIDRHAAQVGDRLHELQYEQLVGDPRATLTTLAGFLGLPADGAWLDAACAEIDTGRSHRGGEIAMPPGIAGAINEYQERYGFPGRATTA